MSAQPPSLGRKSSTAWDRLRPAKQDLLESMGFISKGDTRLLEPKTQESYYNKIVARYMQFCTQNSKELETAFASLSLNGTPSASSDPARNPPVPTFANANGQAPTPSSLKVPPLASSRGSSTLAASPSPSAELSIILLALRKLREALLATSSSAESPIFSQRVHVFSIRLAILAFHPPSYYPSLLHLLFVLHDPQYPLPDSELSEMTTYLILDLACRQGEFASAYSLRSQSNRKSGYESIFVDAALNAIVTDNWVAFWRVRRKVDGYVRALLQWSVDKMRRNTLKALGRAYLGCDLDWVLQSATGGEMEWEELAREENVGWIRDGDKITIRKPKSQR